MNKKNCFDCFNFKAKIPLISNKTSICSAPDKKCKILKSKLAYSQATAKCSFGLLATDDGEPRIFKNVLKSGQRLKSYEYAEKCPNFEGC